jgi:hypothetical protein
LNLLGETGQKYKKVFRLLVKCRLEEIKAFERYYGLLRTFIKLFRNKKYDQSHIDLQVYEDKLNGLAKLNQQALKLKPIKDYVTIVQNQIDLNKHDVFNFKYDPVVTFFPNITTSLAKTIHQITSLDRKRCAYLFDKLFLGNFDFHHPPSNARPLNPGFHEASFLSISF